MRPFDEALMAPLALMKSARTDLVALAGLRMYQVFGTPFDRISWPTTGYHAIAVVAGSNLYRQLRPRTGRPASMAERPVPDRQPAVRILSPSIKAGGSDRCW